TKSPKNIDSKTGECTASCCLHTCTSFPSIFNTTLLCGEGDEKSNWRHVRNPETDLRATCASTMILSSLMKPSSASNSSWGLMNLNDPTRVPSYRMEWR
ncbi:hypothetical protein PFISCL1PPCAC_20651, partial [Pristionchus fissidentatus]